MKQFVYRFHDDWRFGVMLAEDYMDAVRRIRLQFDDGVVSIQEIAETGYNEFGIQPMLCVYCEVIDDGMEQNS